MEVEKLIEKLSQEQNESSKVVRIALAYAEFASLVKRMREAQKEERKYGTVYFKTEEERVAYGGAIRRMFLLESDVDEYLEKIETDGRKTD